MGTTTAIAWTDHTFNPWMGCSKVSPGCDNCYAESLNKRTGKAQWGDDAVRVVTSDGYWKNPLKWDRMADRNGVRARVFCASMADVFEDRPDLHAPRARLWSLIEETPNLDWQLLTKRPENVLGMLPWKWRTDMPSNVWIGATVEDQPHAEQRLPALWLTDARVRFLSCEPLLGRIDLSPWLREGWLDWVIVGGESGGSHRPLDLSAARDLRDQCHQYGVPFFFKQVGGRFPHSGGDELDGRSHKEFPKEACR